MGRTSAPPPVAGDLVDGRYRLVEILARGGTAVVWRGHDLRLRRCVAVKLLDSGQTDERSWYEARSLAQLSHPHIASVFDYGVHRGRAYVVLELVEGPTVSRVLADHRMPWAAAVVVAAQTAAALAAAHSRGLVHRDVTPRNILLGPGGVKLVDFGISAVSGDGEIDADGALRGTPMYAAPERMDGQRVEEPSDVYSLGVVLYRALADRMPWPATMSTLQPVTEPNPLPFIQDLPVAVADLCMRCLASDPEERPTASEAARILREAAPQDALARFANDALDGFAPVTQLVSRIATQRRRTGPRRAATLAAVAGAAALVGLAVWSMADWGGDQQSPTPQTIAMPAAAPQEQSGCTAIYQPGDTDGRTFSAVVTVTANGNDLPGGWRLTLTTPSGAVATPGQESLAAGGHTPIPLTGSGKGAAPTAATAGGIACDLLVLGRTPTLRPPSVVQVAQVSPGAGTSPPPATGNGQNNSTANGHDARRKNNAKGHGKGKATPKPDATAPTVVEPSH